MGVFFSASGPFRSTSSVTWCDSSAGATVRTVKQTSEGRVRKLLGSGVCLSLSFERLDEEDGRVEESFDAVCEAGFFAAGEAC